MALNPRLVTEIIRQKLGTTDDNIAARVAIQIPEALKATGRKIAADPDLRQLLVTDRSATTAAIASGVVDLTTPYSSFRFLMEYFDLGLVYLLPSSTATAYDSGPSSAYGTWTFVGNPAPNETIDVNGVTLTFKPPSILVAGAGDAGANTTYVYNGLYNGRPFYNPVMQSVDPLAFSIVWGIDEPAWYITDLGGDILYNNGEEDVATPDLSAGWLQSNGTLPAPTSVTAVAPTGSNVGIGDTLTETAANFATALNANGSVLLTVAYYESSANVVTGHYRTTGAGGNAFTLAASSGASVAVSGSTFAGGAAQNFRISVATDLPGIQDLSRVRFSTTGTLPTGIASSSTDYYVTDYEAATTGDRGTAASFTLSSTSTGSVPATVTSTGSGVLTVSLMDADGVPLQRLKNPQQSVLPRYLDSVFTYYYWQGNELFILPASIAGMVAFAVPSYPTNLAAMPESEEAERIFLEKLVELLVGGDAAQDGEK